MYRFCIATLLVCAAFLLALQFFVSFTPVQASSHSVTITSPVAGSWQGASFNVGYDALNAGTCELQTQNGTGNPWVSRGTIACGANRSTSVQVPAWCSTQGLDQCGIRISAQPVGQTTFNYTGGVQTWTVPAGVTSIKVDARGAQGASGENTGKGGRVLGDISVTPGETLYIYVGGTGEHGTNISVTGGAGGFNGGGKGGNSLAEVINSSGSGGGGASDIRQNGNTLFDRVVVAGGGGGSLHGYPGGDGGGLSGTGAEHNGTESSQSSGGSGGSPGDLHINPDPRAGLDGTLGVGGAGAHCTQSGCHGGSGGGGGYYGGGGGGNGGFQRGGGSGGGGSSLVPPGGTTEPGFRLGNGQVIITYSPSGEDYDQEYFSIDTTNPVVRITAPVPASLQTDDFPLTYNATDEHIGTCTIATSSDNGASWDNQGTVACGGTGLTTTVDVSWCRNFGFPQCGIRVTAKDLAGNTAFADLFVNYTPPIPYGLIPCGVDRNNPETDWNDMEDCQLRHSFLLIKILIDFTLWKLVPLIIVILAVATGVIFYFQLGDVSVLATVRRIWHYVGIGVLILLFSWLFLNFLLGIFGFDVNIFGRWTDITV